MELLLQIKIQKVLGQFATPKEKLRKSRIFSASGKKN